MSTNPPPIPPSNVNTISIDIVNAIKTNSQYTQELLNKKNFFVKFLQKYTIGSQLLYSIFYFARNPNLKLFKKLKLLRDHGRDDKGDIKLWGTNARLDNLQAAFLNFKLKNLKNFVIVEY